MADLNLITSATKIFDLLKTYPQIADMLFEFAPQLKKFNNPMVMNTIGKMTSLGDAAGAAGVNTDDLISKIKGFIGQ